jgi:hypothetical protein
MADGASGGATTQVGGPAAIAGALRVLDRHARTIVRLAIAQHVIRDADVAGGVASMHDRVSTVLHEVSLEHGTDAMATAAEYAAAALDAGTLYPGEELEAFVRSVAAGARATSKELTRHTPFGA